MESILWALKGAKTQKLFKSFNLLDFKDHN